LFSRLIQLAALYSHVLAAEREQNDIDQSLDHIEQQQKDLGSTLDAYEKATQEVFGHSGSLRALDTGPADTERDKKCAYSTHPIHPSSTALANIYLKKKTATCSPQTCTRSWTTSPARSRR
jgi:hypothetical protein